MFLRNAWYVAAWGHEIKESVLARTLLNDPVVLFRDSAGKVRALEDRCCHRGAPLALGEVVEQGLRCGYHGLVFNGEGICVDVPGQTQIPANARVRSYPVVEKDEFVWIWMGDAAKASTDLIIDYPYNNDYAEWPHQHAVMPIKCNYRLLLDNLMDLTHLGLVHKTTIGGNLPQHANAKMKTTKTPTGVKYVRWMLESVPPPAYIAVAGFKGKVDRWQEFEFVAPSCIVQYTGAVDAGTGAYDLGKRDGGVQIRLLHAITPETDSTCLYFWVSAAGNCRSYPEAADKLFQAACTAFNEDKRVVEQQQLRLNGYDENNLVDIASDSARVQMFRHLTQLIAEENGSRLAAAAE